jgi:hypothetical protein
MLMHAARGGIDSRKLGGQTLLFARLGSGHGSLLAFVVN